jgi:hypothetical protein
MKVYLLYHHNDQELNISGLKILVMEAKIFKAIYLIKITLFRDMIVIKSKCLKALNSFKILFCNKVTKRIYLSFS